MFGGLSHGVVNSKILNLAFISFCYETLQMYLGDLSLFIQSADCMAAKTTISKIACYILQSNEKDNAEIALSTTTCISS